MQTRNPLAVLALSTLLSGLAAQAGASQVPTDFPTIAAALSAAEAGDIIVLAAGFYPESGLRVPTGVTLRGGGATAAETVIDAQGNGRILLIESVPDSTVIANLTLRNAVATGATNHEQSGGAILISRSAVRVQGCTFENNVAASHGGAIRVSAASPIISNCTFRDNQAPNGGGGGIDASFGSSPLIAGCVFENNTARWGGALSVRLGGVAAVTFTSMVGNRAGGNLGYGGAVFADGNSVIGYSDGVMAGNQAEYGGAAACFASSAVNLNQVTVTNNGAAVLGGGMFLADASPHVTGTIFANNIGEAISLAGVSQPVIACSDLHGNSAGDWTPSLLTVTDMTVNYAVDPVFCSEDPQDEDGLRLRYDSPLLSPGSGCPALGAYPLDCGLRSTTEVPGGRSGIAATQASPNPFNPRTRINFGLNESQTVEVAIFGVRGDLVRTLCREVLAPGEHEYFWEGRDESGRSVGSGVYLAVVRGEQATKTIKLALLK